MIEIELPALKAYGPSAIFPEGLNAPPCYVLRTPAGIWKYLNRDKQADGAKTVPHYESMIAEALYQQFTAPARQGRVLGLSDGTLLTSLGNDGWALHNPALGRAIAHMSEYEAKYLTDLAVALGTDVLLANATELEHRLREVQGVAAARRDAIKENHRNIDALLGKLEAARAANDLQNEQQAKASSGVGWALWFSAGLIAGAALVSGVLRAAAI